MNLALRKPITLAEFLEWEERQPLRYEFDGVGPVAMAGGSVRHTQIQRNLAFALTARLSAVSRVNSSAAISRSRPEKTTPATPTASSSARP
jgi:hypothetical protein